MIDEPWDDFFDPEEFAVEASFSSSSGELTTVSVLLEENFDPQVMRNFFDYQNERTGLTAQARAITIHVPTHLCPDLFVGQVITINGKPRVLLEGWHPIADGKIMNLKLTDSHADQNSNT